ncbi:MAG: rhomboid family intramembrane serine protease [Gammaproteobacteria bacterium]|nr:rhomboid family intramembrane serine protease [Gammaproteobacteria bacterium]
MNQFTPVVLGLLISNISLFFLSAVAPGLATSFALWPLSMPVNSPVSFQVWQLVTYGFLHANMSHLFFNMFALWMFGMQLEALWGSKPFALYYFVCLIGAGLIQIVVETSGYPTVGASGGVFGLLLGFGLMYPNRPIIMIFLPIPIKAKYFVVLYGLLELWLGVTATRSTVAHFAHLGGMAFGYVLIQYWRGRLPWKPYRRLNR